MRRMLFESPGCVRWVETEPLVLEGQHSAIVRPITVATCDLDVAALRGRFPMEGPYPFGHEGVAEVLVIGDGVTTIVPGDLVVVPFQISCGDCPPCRRGNTGNCLAQAPMSTYGLGSMGGLQWGGLLADEAYIPFPDAMLVPLPAGIDPIVGASASDNIPDGWRTVGPQLAEMPEADVLIVGGDGGPNSIGLYACGIAAALGANRVVYLDDADDRLSIADGFGADVVKSSPTKRAGSFHITVDASGSESGLRCAINSTARDGVCTSPSVYFNDQTMPLFSMYARCCTFHTGRAHVRPAIPHVLDLIRSGFDPTLVTTSVIDWNDATEALSDPPLKLVLARPPLRSPGGN